ncbi:MAG: cytidine deaminase [Lachnospira sp.]|nr:cytidine deaminase [Lachnospira sp.]
MKNDSELMDMAKEAMKSAYAPYSHFSVGAAVETDDGEVYCGCNIENSSYGATICAERTAISKAVSEGYRRITRIAICDSNNSFAWPCGICRQVMSEFAVEDFYVILEDNGKLSNFFLKELLPNSFSGKDMNKK